MNRLIIIGNGFDLAHQMKTGYNHFVMSYLKNCLHNAHESIDSYFETELILVKSNQENTVNLDDSKHMNDYWKYNSTNLHNGKDSNEIKRFLNHHNTQDEFRFFIKHEFINTLFSNYALNKWVDIEQFYFNYLKVIKNDSVSKIQSLNKAFDNLRIELAIYMQKQHPEKLSVFYENIFKSPMAQKYFSNSIDDRHRASEFPLPDNTLFLNFNYTSSIHQYFIKYKFDNRYSEIQIHGDTHNLKNPIILGYGDELNPSYRELLKGNPEFSRFFKNYWYSKTVNYQKFEEFINNSRFEVYLIGHSCGSSDSVLLRTVLEHSNCRLVHIHRHEREDGTNDFFNIHHNLSKLITFENQSLLRTILLDEESSTVMPQIK